MDENETEGRVNAGSCKVEMAEDEEGVSGAGSMGSSSRDEGVGQLPEDETDGSKEDEDLENGLSWARVTWGSSSSSS